MNPTVGQVLDPNVHHWKGPAYRGDSGAEWVQEHGFGAEDWNFDFKQEVEGHLYGYGQGRVSAERRHETDRFDVFFFIRDEAGIYRAAGVYLNAEYLDDDAALVAWEMLRTKGIVGRRSSELQAAFGRHQTAGRKAVKAFDEGVHVRWRVAVEDVLVFKDLPSFTPYREKDWRANNAYDWSDYPWSSLDLGPGTRPAPLEAEEGNVSLRLHAFRERSARFQRAVRARRRAAAADGRLRCEACEFDFGRAYGSHLDGFVEAHHTIPLASREGAGTVKEEDIALLCANCHRAAHKARAFTVPELKALLEAAKLL